jgi:hypothetical protein
VALLFCARGGLRLQVIFEQFLGRTGLTVPCLADGVMISRLVAARLALTSGSAAALDEIEREFSGDTMAEIAIALAQQRLVLGTEWNAPFNRQAFLQLFGGDSRQAVALRARIDGQNELFRRHLASRSGNRNRIILCDSGLYGSTMRMIAKGLPAINWTCVLFARSNYKSFPREHFARTRGLSVESDGYSPVAERTAILRYWHLIESVLEPDLLSVTAFESTEGEPRSNLEQAGWKAKLPPSDDEAFAGVVDYIDGLGPRDFAATIYHDADVAWRRLRRAVIWPSKHLGSLLSPESRSRDFGRESAVVPIETKGQGLAQRMHAIRGSLWREGAIAISLPYLRLPLLAGLETAHVARAIRRAWRKEQP